MERNKRIKEILRNTKSDLKNDKTRSIIPPKGSRSVNLDTLSDGKITELYRKIKRSSY